MLFRLIYNSPYVKLLAWASSLYIFFSQFFFIKGTFLGRYLALEIFSHWSMFNSQVNVSSRIRSYMAFFNSFLSYHYTCWKCKCFRQYWACKHLFFVDTFHWFYQCVIWYIIMFLCIRSLKYKMLTVFNICSYIVACLGRCNEE